VNYSRFDEAMEQSREDDSLQEMLDQGTSPILASPPVLMQLSPMQCSYMETSIQLSPMQSNGTHSFEQPPFLQPQKTNVHYTSVANQSNIVTNLLDLTGKSKTAGRQGVKRKHVQYDKPSIYQHTVDWDVLEGDIGADEEESEPKETDEASGSPAGAIVEQANTTEGLAEEEWLPGASQGPEIVTVKPAEAPVKAPGGPAGVTGVNPILAKVLRFKTKYFPTPMNIQYLGMFNEKMLISDGQNYQSQLPIHCKQAQHQHNHHHIPGHQVWHQHEGRLNHQNVSGQQQAADQEQAWFSKALGTRPLVNN
jgi:hypothetical protein